MGRLFGTDGARGIANTELTCELSMKIGRAAAMVLACQKHAKPKIIIGKDTRISSDMLEAALVAGLCSVGADAVLIGVVPTPAVAYLVSALKADAGIMISASHNPCEYNGIKLFSGAGYKLPDEVEEQIEAIVLDGAGEISVPTGGGLGRVITDHSAVDAYIKHISTSVNVTFEGMKVALDCANGSSAATAQRLFESLGAECHMLSDKPDGVNINAGCGSTHMENITKYVVENKMDLGLAFDGDADRCLAVDENGCLVDGDIMMAIFASYMKKRGTLADNALVVTVMSNLGIFHFAKENGIETKITKVGDRYVLEEMREHGYSIGGEQSGHIIFLKHATTGDGQLSGIQLMGILKATGKKLSELAQVMNVFPQVLVNVSVGAEGKARFDTDEAVQKAIAKNSELLGDDGRVLVRISGTEPLIRVMVEGKCHDKIKSIAEEIATVIKERLS